MKKHKYKFNKIILGLYLLILALPLDISHAGKVKIRSGLIDGINKINVQSYLLNKSQEEKYQQLQYDLDEFYEKGSSKIKSSNMFYVLRENDFSADELENGLEGTNLAGLGADFKKAEETYGVNAILLMAMAKHETGNGTSELFTNKNNLFGFNAYDYDPYNQAKDFATPGDSIMTVAKHLKQEYLSPDGDFYNGMSTDGIGTLYATDPDWSKKISWMMIEVAESMIDGFENEAGQ